MWTPTPDIIIQSTNINMHKSLCLHNKIQIEKKKKWIAKFIKKFILNFTLLAGHRGNDFENQGILKFLYRIKGTDFGFWDFPQWISMAVPHNLARMHKL